VQTSSAKILRNFCEIRSLRREVARRSFGMTQVGALFAFSIGMLFAPQKASLTFCEAKYFTFREAKYFTFAQRANISHGEAVVH
jgi:hypothetical protein